MKQIVCTPDGLCQVREIFDGRKDLDPTRYGYKLATPGQYASTVVIPDKMDIDEKRMCAWVPFADGNSRDGVGDVTEVTGLDLSRHSRNRICLFDHGKTQTLPIGMSEDRDTKEYTVVIDPIARTAGGWVFFYQGKSATIPGISKADEFEHAIYCEQIFDLMVKGLIKGGSYGYQIIEGDPIQADYRYGTPQGLHLKRTLLLEYGPTIIPANMNTVRKSWDWRGFAETAREIICLNGVCGKPLSPMLVKSLTPYVGDTKLITGYEKKSEGLQYKCPDCNSKLPKVTKDSETVACPNCGTQWNITYPDKNGAAQLRRIGPKKSLAKSNLNLGEPEKMSDTNVPPADWKPGLGAKALAKTVKVGDIIFHKKVVKVDKTDEDVTIFFQDGSKRVYGVDAFIDDSKALNGAVKSIAQLNGKWWVEFSDGTNRGPFNTEDDAMVVHRQPDVSAKAMSALNNSTGGALIGAKYQSEFVGDQGFWDEEKKEAEHRKSLRMKYRKKAYSMAKTEVVKVPGYKHTDGSLRPWHCVVSTSDGKRVGAFPCKDEATAQRFADKWKMYSDDEISGGRLASSFPNLFIKSLTKSLLQDAAHRAMSSGYKEWQDYGGEWKPLAELGKKTKWDWQSVDFTGSTIVAVDPSGTKYTWKLKGLVGYNKAMEEYYQIKQVDGKWWVIWRGQKLGGPFNTEREAQDAQSRIVEANKLQSKSLHPLRMKYRSVKGCRRRMKSSRPGSSILYVRGKDLQQVKEDAEKKGLKFAHIGSHSTGHAKVKLMGDDSMIDGIAKSWGRRLKGKSLNGVASITLIDKKTDKVVGSSSVQGDYKKVEEEARRVAANKDVEIRIQFPGEGWYTISKSLKKGLGFDVIIPTDDPNDIIQKAQLAGIMASAIAENDINGVQLSGVDEIEIGRFLRKWNLLPDTEIEKMYGGRIGGRQKSLMSVKGKAWELKDNGKVVATGPSHYTLADDLEEQLGVKTDTIRWNLEPGKDGYLVGDHNGHRYELIKQKSLPNKGHKAMDQTEQKPLENAGDIEAPIPDEAPVPQTTEPENDEPFGAQVLRRIHEDHMLLMEEYDSWMKNLEHEGVKGHLQKQLERLEECLTETEDMFGKEYEELPELEGAMETKDLESADEGSDEVEETEEQDTEADSSEKEPPTEEEAVEAMQSKSIDIKKVKSLRNGLRKSHTCTCGKKSMCAECGHEPCTCDKKSLVSTDGHEPGAEAEKISSDKTRDENMKRMKKKGGLGVEDGHEPGKEAETGSELKIKRMGMKTKGGPGSGPQGGRHKPGQDPQEYDDEAEDGTESADDLTDEEVAEIEKQHKNKKKDLGIEDGHEPGHEAESGSTLQPHEKAMVGEASDFLHDLSTEQNFGHEHRLKSFHYGKALDQLGVVNDIPDGAGTEGEMGNEMGKSRKQFPEAEKEDREVGVSKKQFPEEQAQDSEVNVNVGDKIAAASKFLKGLSYETAFGDNHREEALMHHKNLDPLGHEVAQAFEPGEMGEKQFKEEEKEDDEVNVTKGEKSADPIGKEDDQVEITNPSGDSKYTPGKEPMQQLGKKALNALKKQMDARDKEINRVFELTKQLAASLN